jgi:hypothetical protein
METMEVRIGNWIKTNEEVFRPGEQTVSKIETLQINNYHKDFCEPIPLTEEWLLKFGFYLNTGKMFLPMNYNRGLCVDGIRVTLHDESGFFFLCNLEYVHSLQNLFFSLTGTELEIKK